MSYDDDNDDEYKYPCYRDNGKYNEVLMTNDMNHVMEPYFYTAMPFHGVESTLGKEENKNGNVSYSEIPSLSNGYSSGGNLSHKGYNEIHAEMPSLLPVGPTRNLHPSPIDEPDTSSAIATKISPSDSFHSTGTIGHRDPIYRNSPYYSEAPSISPLEGYSESGSSESSSSTYRPCDRPIPPRSAFMMFSHIKREEIMRMAGPSEMKGSVKTVAMEWRKLSRDKKKYWEDMAKEDKARYASEKQLYSANVKGASLVKKLRAKKHPNAPKRPMSAFLMYAQHQRKVLQKENPDMPNADISRLLGETWRNLCDEEKLPYLKREEAERNVYRVKMKSWKNDQKLINSLKTLSERKRDTDTSDEREDVESDTAKKYDSYEEPHRDHAEAFTPAYNYGHHHELYYHNVGTGNERYSSEWNFSQVLDNVSHEIPKFTYPRPSNEYTMP